MKPEWWNSNNSSLLLLCGVWDCISDCLGGRRQLLVQFLFPNGYIDIHNNLYFSSFDKPFHFQWPRKKFWKWTVCNRGWCLDTWDSKNNNPFYIKFHPVLRGGGEKLYQTHYRSRRFLVVSDISLSSRNRRMSHQFFDFNYCAAHFSNFPQNIVCKGSASRMSTTTFVSKFLIPLAREADSL